MMTATQYRAKLETEKTKIERMQSTPDGRNSLMLRNRLNSIVENLTALDNGEHFAHQPSDTLSRIVISDLLTSGPKKLNQ